MKIKNTMMKIFRRTMPLLTAALLLIACDKDTAGTPEGGEPSDGGGMVEMTFGLSASELKTPAVKAGAVDDDLLDNLWVLQFDGQADGSALKLCEYYPSDKIENNTVSVALYESDTPVRIYFVANTGADEFASLAAGSTLGTFESRVLGMADETAVSGAGYLPMTGVYDGSVSTQTQTVTLTRMVAKIAFTCTVDITAAGESFSIGSIRLIDAATGTRYKELAVPTAQAGLFPDAASGDNFTDYALESASASETAEITRTWYLPENLRGVVEGLTAKTKGGDNVPAHSTCIEVSGDYTKDGTIYDVTYRIYPGQNNSTDFNLIRNHSYTIASTIKGFNEYDLRVEVDKGIPAGEYLDGEWTE